MEMEHKLPLEIMGFIWFLVDSTFCSQFWILAFIFFFLLAEKLCIEVIELLTLRMNS